jgi:hypothetical protein
MKRWLPILLAVAAGAIIASVVWGWKLLDLRLEFAGGATSQLQGQDRAGETVRNSEPDGSRAETSNVGQRTVVITAQPNFELRNGASYLHVQEGTNVATVLWSTLQNPPPVPLDSRSLYTFTFVMEEKYDRDRPYRKLAGEPVQYTLRLVRVQDRQGTLYDWERSDRLFPPPVPYTFVAHQHLVPGMTNIHLRLTCLMEPYVTLVLKEKGKMVGFVEIRPSRVGSEWWCTLHCLTKEFYEVYGAESVITVMVGAMHGAVRLRDAEVRSTDTGARKLQTNDPPDGAPRHPVEKIQ